MRRTGQGEAAGIGAAAQEAAVATVAAVRDDRVLGTTRALAVVVAPVLLVASSILFGFPDQTAELWAWTIRPTMTAMLMGSGYFSGIPYFIGVGRARSWAAVGVMFLPITVFVVFMALATALHWERFALAHPSAWAWFALYAATPFVLPWAWWRNQRHDPGARPGEALFAPALRAALGAVGALGLLAIVVAFVRPPLLIEVWPWTLTPLTARVVLGWFALPAALFVALAVDGRVRTVGLTVRSALARDRPGPRVDRPGLGRVRSHGADPLALRRVLRSAVRALRVDGHRGATRTRRERSLRAYGVIICLIKPIIRVRGVHITSNATTNEADSTSFFGSSLASLSKTWTENRSARLPADRVLDSERLAIA